MTFINNRDTKHLYLTSVFRISLNNKFIYIDPLLSSRKDSWLTNFLFLSTYQYIHRT